MHNDDRLQALTLAPGLLLFALLAAAPAGKYPLRFPVLRDAARQAVAERFRAQNEAPRITKLSVDAYGFIELLGVENAETYERPTAGRAGFGPRETRFWVDLLGKNAAFFGVMPTSELRPVPAPMQTDLEGGRVPLAGHARRHPIPDR